MPLAEDCAGVTRRSGGVLICPPHAPCAPWPLLWPLGRYIGLTSVGALAPRAEVRMQWSSEGLVHTTQCQRSSPPLHALSISAPLAVQNRMLTPALRLLLLPYSWWRNTPPWR
jgi:hypothetical protein